MGKKDSPDHLLNLLLGSGQALITVKDCALRCTTVSSSLAEFFGFDDTFGGKPERGSLGGPAREEEIADGRSGQQENRRFC